MRPALTVPPLTHFPLPLVLVDVGIDLGHGADGRGEGLVGIGASGGVLQDLAQQQWVFGDPLHRHHQEEAEVRGACVRPGGEGNFVRPMGKSSPPALLLLHASLQAFWGENGASPAPGEICCLEPAGELCLQPQWGFWP